MDCVTIVMVTLNAEKTIERTIRSVLNQDYPVIECVFIDGGSIDRTNEVIEHYREAFNRKGYALVHISEKDDGIYDAMNKGIHYSTGQWIMFLNANDRLADKRVIQDVFGVSHSKQIGFIYGHTINDLDGRRFLRKSSRLDCLYYKSPYVHQALFVRRDMAITHMFNTNRKYLADYEQALLFLMERVPYKQIDRVISVFDLSGVSQTRVLDCILERESILREYHLAHKRCLKKYSRYLFVILIKGNRFFYRCFCSLMKEL